MYPHLCPKIGVGKSDRNNLCSGAMLDDRKCLFEVSTKERSDSSKWPILVQQISQSAIHRFHHMTILRNSFIPDDKRSPLEKLVGKIILLDIADTLLMAENGNLEVRMDYMTTREEKRSNACRSHTEYNLAIGMNSRRNEVGDIGLATSTTTLKEEHGASCIFDTIQDCLVEISLLHIESGLTSLYKLLQLWNIECHLLIYKLVSSVNTPVHLWSRHVKVLYALATFLKGISYKMEAIVKDLLLGRIWDMENGVGILKIMLQVITEMIPTLLPKPVGIHRSILDQNDDKDPVQLETSLENDSILKTSQPLSIIL